ncbi:phytanoyl-CoA dioxygenase, peroxisomal [Dendroctonus ponderosae]|uniref:phytanoyl-CoA dioxygenase n=2 Tax=Dendroctonus ponderosae TaxID=77166 RepID=J3JVT7_DENPD|nr:phytanoyl-CoA dioxygenase, peroxisomal [Dendroctonus ponderosae]XP_019755054.2 phytanoyl-CoA dioxygenase, peroxisomal [Dendroctonus ponderosae]AEE62317.1 unknown [Dendroctonus ponderosae]KAH1015172.1 hypothetical protein HUJ05_012941 [Dendroctonus ponderosae]KAH1015175.1 hypothetical protein HUJ05_012944 [Dendroctonus ponderosae]
MAYIKRSLTPEQKQFYEDNGYIVVRNNVDPEVLDNCMKRFIDICKGSTDHQVFMVMKDPSLKHSNAKGEHLIDKLQDFAFDPVFWSYASDVNVVNVVEEIIGPNITVAHSMFINKPPNAKASSSLHPLHQDIFYFPFRPPNKIVASWTALERVDESNGCLYVISGSHKGPMYEHTYPEGFRKPMYLGVQGFDHLKKTFVIMEKGDTVFFHPHILHGSGPNRTQGFRKAISCHYADSNCEFIDVRGTSQEQLAVELEATAQKLGLTSTNFIDVWKIKSRLVRGKPGSFQQISSRL